MIVTPVTELDAVNEMLSAIGSSPVNTLDIDNNVDVINALRLLRATSLEVQSKGWDFNIEENVSLKPDFEKGLVPCPPEFIRYQATGYKLIQRNGYFFDTLSQTDIFPDGLTVNLVRLIDFQELPQIFRKYITVRASRVFQARYLGSAELDTHLNIEENLAYADIVDYDLTSGNYNVYSNDTFISQNIQRS